MARAAVTVVDADGHLMESIPELAQYMDPDLRREALQPNRNRQGVFPSLDGIHYLRMVEGDEIKERERVTASAERPGSGEDWVAFLDKAEVEHTVLFTTEGLSVGLIQHTQYAVRHVVVVGAAQADRDRR